MLRLLPVSFAVLALSLAPLPAAAATATSTDLVGTWFVLIHYRDSMTANPDSDRWADKVWKIEQKGSRLQWSEYPIVVFNDGSGRFGAVAGNPRARLMHKWEPNESQMTEIMEGPQVNSRGSKTKSLRGSLTRGYKSSTASRSTSAFVVSYQETWSIDDPLALPIFTRDDALGTESALATKSNEVVSGRTRYATLEISEDGNILTGTYARDDNKKGTFKLIRAGAVQGLKSDGRTPNQKAQDRGREQYIAAMREEVRRRAAGEPPGDLGGTGGGPDVNRFQQGTKLRQVLEAVRAPSTSNNASVLVRKLEVVRIGADGVVPIDDANIESGKFKFSDDHDYGVVASRFCSSRESQTGRTSWYLLPKNSLAAWEHSNFHEFCVMQTDYKPAWSNEAGLEKSLTDYAKDKFPTSPVSHMFLYERGMALVSAGRLADAEATLALADKSVDTMAQGLAGSRIGRDRRRLASTSDKDALRERLVQVIESAKQAGGDSPE